MPSTIYKTHLYRITHPLMAPDSWTCPSVKFFAHLHKCKRGWILKNVSLAPMGLCFSFTLQLLNVLLPGHFKEDTQSQFGRWQTRVFCNLFYQMKWLCLSTWVGRDWGIEECVPISKFLLRQLPGKTVGSFANTTGPGPAETGDILLRTLLCLSHLNLLHPSARWPQLLLLMSQGLSDAPGPRFSLGRPFLPSAA